MSALSSVLVKFSADISDLQGKLKTGLKDVQGVTDQMSGQGAVMGGVFAKLKGYALPVLAAVTAGAVAMGVGIRKGLNFNAEMEQARMSFETLIGSVDGAKKMVKDLQNFGASTPFEFPGLQNSAKLMLAMGFNAKDIMPNLKSVGDAVAAVGGGEEKLNGVTMALGQMLTKGKVSAEEMNQLAERGIPAWQLMADKMGMSKEELMKLSSQGKIMADQAIPALLDALGTKFDGAMEKQSKSWNGLMSTLRDNFNMILGTATSGLFEKLKPLIKVVTDFTGKIVSAIQQGKGLKGVLESVFPPIISATITGIGTAVKGLFGFIQRNWGIIRPILIGVLTGFTAWAVVTGIMSAISIAMSIATGAVAAFGVVVAFITSPIGIAVVAIGALVAMGYLLYKNWDKIKNFLIQIWNAITAKFRTEITIITTLISTHLNNMKIVFTAIFNTVKAYLTAWWATVKVLFATAFMMLYYLVTGQWGKIGEVWRSAGEKIKGIIGNLFSSVKNIWSNAFSSIINNTLNGVSKIVGTITNLKSQIGSRFSEMVSNATQAGKNLIQGFMNGVLNLGKWLRDKISSFFSDNVLGAAKRVLGIKSPSKVLAIYGKYSAEGFAIGIDKNAPMAVKSASDMARGVTGAVATHASFGYDLGVNGKRYSSSFSVFKGQPVSAPAVAGSGRGDIHVAQLVVREEADIEKIAEALYRLQKRGQRSKGVM